MACIADPTCPGYSPPFFESSAGGAAKCSICFQSIAYHRSIPSGLATDASSASTGGMLPQVCFPPLGAKRLPTRSFVLPRAHSSAKSDVWEVAVALQDVSVKHVLRGVFRDRSALEQAAAAVVRKNAKLHKMRGKWFVRLSVEGEMDEWEEAPPTVRGPLGETQWSAPPPSKRAPPGPRLATMVDRAQGGKREKRKTLVSQALGERPQAEGGKLFEEDEGAKPKRSWFLFGSSSGGEAKPVPRGDEPLGLVAARKASADLGSLLKDERSTLTSLQMMPPSRRGEIKELAEDPRSMVGGVSEQSLESLQGSRTHEASAAEEGEDVITPMPPSTPVAPRRTSPRSSISSEVSDMGGRGRLVVGSGYRIAGFADDPTPSRANLDDVMIAGVTEREVIDTAEWGSTMTPLVDELGMWGAEADEEDVAAAKSLPFASLARDEDARCAAQRVKSLLERHSLWPMGVAPRWSVLNPTGSGEPTAAQQAEIDMAIENVGEEDDELVEAAEAGHEVDDSVEAATREIGLNLSASTPDTSLSSGVVPRKRGGSVPVPRDALAGSSSESRSVSFHVPATAAAATAVPPSAVESKSTALAVETSELQALRAAVPDPSYVLGPGGVTGALYQSGGCTEEIIISQEEGLTPFRKVVPMRLPQNPTRFSEALIVARVYFQPTRGAASADPRDRFVCVAGAVIRASDLQPIRMPDVPASELTKTLVVKLDSVIANFEGTLVLQARRPPGIPLLRHVQLVRGTQLVSTFLLPAATHHQTTGGPPPVSLLFREEAFETSLSCSVPAQLLRARIPKLRRMFEHLSTALRIVLKRLRFPHNISWLVGVLDSEDDPQNEDDAEEVEMPVGDQDSDEPASPALPPSQKSEESDASAPTSEETAVSALFRLLGKSVDDTAVGVQELVLGGAQLVFPNYMDQSHQRSLDPERTSSAGSADSILINPIRRSTHASMATRNMVQANLTRRPVDETVVSLKEEDELEDVTGTTSPVAPEPPPLSEDEVAVKEAVFLIRALYALRRMHSRACHLAYYYTRFFFYSLQHDSRFARRGWDLLAGVDEVRGRSADKVGLRRPQPFFKPSSLKASKRFDGIPTNLHLQLLTVEERVPTSKVGRFGFGEPLTYRVTGTQTGIEATALRRDTVEAAFEAQQAPSPSQPGLSTIAKSNFRVLGHDPPSFGGFGGSRAISVGVPTLTRLLSAAAGSNVTSVKKKPPSPLTEQDSLPSLPPDVVASGRRRRSSSFSDAQGPLVPSEGVPLGPVKPQLSSPTLPRKLSPRPSGSATIGEMQAQDPHLEPWTVDKPAYLPRSSSHSSFSSLLDKEEEDGAAAPDHLSRSSDASTVSQVLSVSHLVASPKQDEPETQSDVKLAPIRAPMPPPLRATGTAPTPPPPPPARRAKFSLKDVANRIRKTTVRWSWRDPRTGLPMWALAAGPTNSRELADHPAVDGGWGPLGETGGKTRNLSATSTGAGSLAPLSSRRRSSTRSVNPRFVAAFSPLAAVHSTSLSAVRLPPDAALNEAAREFARVRALERRRQASSSSPSWVYDTVTMGVPAVHSDLKGPGLFDRRMAVPGLVDVAPLTSWLEGWVTGACIRLDAKLREAREARRREGKERIRVHAVQEEAPRRSLTGEFSDTESDQSEEGGDSSSDEERERTVAEWRDLAIRAAMGEDVVGARRDSREARVSLEDVPEDPVPVMTGSSLDSEAAAGLIGISFHGDWAMPSEKGGADGGLSELGTGAFNLNPEFSTLPAKGRRKTLVPTILARPAKPRMGQMLMCNDESRAAFLAALAAEEREMLVTSQLAAAVVTALSARLDLVLAAKNSVWLELISTAGILVQLESLLSTRGKEITMLEDVRGAVRVLAGMRVRFKRGAEKEGRLKAPVILKDAPPEEEEGEKPSQVLSRAPTMAAAMFSEARSMTRQGDLADIAEEEDEAEEEEEEEDEAGLEGGGAAMRTEPSLREQIASKLSQQGTMVVHESAPSRMDEINELEQGDQLLALLSDLSVAASTVFGGGDEEDRGSWMVQSRRPSVAAGPGETMKRRDSVIGIVLQSRRRGSSVWEDTTPARKNLGSSVTHTPMAGDSGRARGGGEPGSFGLNGRFMSVAEPSFRRALGSFSMSGSFAADNALGRRGSMNMSGMAGTTTSRLQRAMEQRLALVKGGGSVEEARLPSTRSIRVETMRRSSGRGAVSVESESVEDGGITASPQASKVRWGGILPRTKESRRPSAPRARERNENRGLIARLTQGRKKEDDSARRREEIQRRQQERRRRLELGEANMKELAEAEEQQAELLTDMERSMVLKVLLLLRDFASSGLIASGSAGGGGAWTELYAQLGEAFAVSGGAPLSTTGSKDDGGSSIEDRDRQVSFGHSIQAALWAIASSVDIDDKVFLASKSLLAYSIQNGVPGCEEVRSHSALSTAQARLAALAMSWVLPAVAKWCASRAAIVESESEMDLDFEETLPGHSLRPPREDLVAKSLKKVAEKLGRVKFRPVTRSGLSWGPSAVHSGSSPQGRADSIERSLANPSGGKSLQRMSLGLAASSGASRKNSSQIDGPGGHFVSLSRETACLPSPDHAELVSVRTGQLASSLIAVAAGRIIADGFALNPAKSSAKSAELFVPLLMGVSGGVARRGVDFDHARRSSAAIAQRGSPMMRARTGDSGSPIVSIPKGEDVPLLDLPGSALPPPPVPLSRGPSEEGATLVGERAVLSSDPNFPTLRGSLYADPALRAARVRSAGSRTEIEVTLSPMAYDRLPPALTQQAVAIVPVLFTQGINEQQSLANMSGSAASIQRDTNLEALFRLRQYAQLGGRLALGTSTRKLDKDLNNLATLIREESTSVQKRPRILQVAADITRVMQGLRVTFCKSGKDRTSMSVTLEEMRVLAQFHGLSHFHFDETVSLVRKHGVRLEICRKNVGQPRYAFNRLQSRMIPPDYRPPAETYGSTLAT
jgi:hypothetical protein